MRNSLRWLSVGALLWLAACSTADDEDKNDLVKGRPAEEVYQEGMDLLGDNKPSDAIKVFESLQQEYPLSPWARKSQLMGAYAAYKRNKYDDAISMYEAYIQLYPASEQTAYAYYMIGLCYYEQITDTLRDQAITQKAQDALQDVVRRYPDSDYAKDARIKLDLVYDHLAGKEMTIGRYYLRKKEWLPAITRFRFVVDNYQTTSHVPEALHRMVEAYMAMGMRDDARRAAAVLGYNYPGSPWYVDSYRLLVGDPGADVVMPQETPWWDSVKSAVGL